MKTVNVTYTGRKGSPIVTREMGEWARGESRDVNEQVAKQYVDGVTFVYTPKPEPTEPPKKKVEKPAQE